jgi:hypothetical protein
MQMNRINRRRLCMFTGSKRKAEAFPRICREYRGSKSSTPPGGVYSRAALAIYRGAEITPSGFFIAFNLLRFDENNSG